MNKHAVEVLQARPHLDRTRIGGEAREHAVVSLLTRPTKFTVLLFPGFSQLSLSSMIEPLRVANTLLGREQFRWQLASLDGEPVRCASGFTMGVDRDFRTERKDVEMSRFPDALLLCSGEGIEDHCSAEVSALLRLCVRQKVMVYALGTATWLLAQLGLLNASRCTIHWDKIPALSETFYGLDVNDALFMHDGSFVTCAGEFAAFDLAIDVLKRRCSPEIVARVCQYVIADRGRPGDAYQYVPPGLQYTGKNEKLIQVIRIMQQHIERPAALDDMPEQVGLSRRQIERLFQRNLGTTPGQYYLSLRLNRARQLLVSTNLSITSVSTACGFSSSSYFSNCFRNEFGMRPQEVRH
jgi:transcriptional regulator GlxA family with amidase domain